MFLPRERRHFRLDLPANIPPLVVLFDGPEEQGAPGATRFPQPTNVPLFLFALFVFQMFALVFDHEKAAVGEFGG